MKEPVEVGVDFEAALAHLNEHGYVVLKNVLPAEKVVALREAVDTLFAQEKENPFDPGDTASAPEDAEMEAYLAESYPVSEAELARLMRRVRHTRFLNHGTPWPVAPQDVLKLFLHLPTLFDQDRSQRIWNLPAKGDIFPELIENLTVLHLVRAVLGQDCVLSECSATSVGPHTEGGAWHQDVPLGQLPEPLPDFPLCTQNAFMLDHFTEENGATRLVPGSHKTRRKPGWQKHGDQQVNEIALTGGAGSLALWLSNTWHRHGPNSTDGPRRAVLSYYCRSWIKPFTDFRALIAPEQVSRYSPLARYLMGFSSNPPIRG